MSDPNKPVGDPNKKDPNPRKPIIPMLVEMWRGGRSSRVLVIVWGVVLLVALYLIGTGVVGILTKAR